MTFSFLPQTGLRGISGLHCSGARKTHKGSLAQPDLPREAGPAPLEPAPVSSPPTGNHCPRTPWLQAPRWTGTSSVSCGSCNPGWWCRRSWGTWGRRWWCWGSGWVCGGARSAPPPCSCATCNWECRWWSGCRRPPPGPGAVGRRQWSAALSHTWPRTCTWAGDTRRVKLLLGAGGTGLPTVTSDPGMGWLWGEAAWTLWCAYRVVLSVLSTLIPGSN